MTTINNMPSAKAEYKAQALLGSTSGTSPPAEEQAKAKTPTEDFVYDPAVIDPVIAEMNAEFCVMDRAGKVCIMRWLTSRVHPGQLDTEYMSVDSFHLMMRQRKTVVPYKVRDGNDNETNEIKHKKVLLSHHWLAHPQMRQYDNGMAFMPNVDAKETGDKDHRCLNLWQGFAFPSAAGDWSLFRAHMLDNVCGGNQEYFDYLIRWMAWVVQKRKRSEVCVLLRGDEEGTGKGFFATHFGILFGPAFWEVNNPEHVIGKFNPHLETLLVLNADEAIFAGDQRHRNALWGLITEKWITIEPKNFAAYKAPNYLNIIITTNEESCASDENVAPNFCVERRATSTRQSRFF